MARTVSAITISILKQRDEMTDKEDKEAGDKEKEKEGL